jgi:hypothetical protein
MDRDGWPPISQDGPTANRDRRTKRSIAALGSVGGDVLGYARLKHWCIYGEEGLAGSETALWLQAGSLTLEHAGHALWRYEMEYASGGDRLARVAGSRLFETPYAPP